ncbi:MAG TPA: peptidoglycan DD-metalloendopeptidase family protein [Usitatibacter sp.]|nr:peptidoglycan DD-metalloendopeptidase family protein [Usitatibacter sp.]
MRAAGRAVRLGLAAFAALLLLAAAPAPPATEESLRELRGRIERLQADLAAAEKTSGEAADQLRESGKAVSEAQRALFALARQRSELEAELGAISAREKETRAGIARQEALAASLLRLQYQQGAPDRLRLMLEGRDAAALARHAAYYQYIQKARAGLIAGLRGKGEELARLQEEAVARRDELAQNQAEQVRETRRLEKERAARAAVVTRLAGEIARSRREIGKLKRDEARLARLVEEIAKALAAKAAREARDAKAAKKGGEGEARRGRAVDQVADASTASRPFESLKGRLRLPVRGELMNRYGGAREESGATWKGLFIRAAAGDTVRAVADGQVVYADWLRGFGNLLILDHGKGFMSLYAHNDGLLRQVGEKVRSGDPLASVGNSGGMAESGLYFELRRDGKPFDPMRWVQ